MGLRGVRLFLRHLDLFKTQLRAILRASTKGKVRVMIPMVSSVGEVVAARRLLEQAAAELAAEGVELKEELELGILVEIPSAAIQLDSFLPHVDFVSIGTNDLIQYTLAVDRINENVTHLYDPFHPAVVRLLESVVRTAHSKGKWVGVCGEMTSDPRAVPLLVGMGVDAMSVSPRMFLRVKQTIRGLKHEAMKRVVAKALACSESDEIRRLLEQSS
jgi:phosphotransferase system enzyme I (PtsI)